MVHKNGVRGPAKNRDLVVEDILDGALKLLEEAEGDVASVTLGDLARSLGYATSALYRYFPSKEALFTALQRRALASFAAELQQALDTHEVQSARREAPAVALERPAVAALAYATLPARAPAQFRLIALSLGDPAVRIPDELALPVGGALALLFGRVEALLEAAAEAGAISRDEPGRAPALFAAVHGALLLDKLARLELPALASSVLVPRTLEMVLVGFGATPRAAGAAVGRAVESVTRTFAS